MLAAMKSGKGEQNYDASLAKVELVGAITDETTVLPPQDSSGATTHCLHNSDFLHLVHCTIDTTGLYFSPITRVFMPINGERLFLPSRNKMPDFIRFYTLHLWDITLISQVDLRTKASSRGSKGTMWRYILNQPVWRSVLGSGMRII